MELVFDTRPAEYWSPVAQESLQQEQTAELAVPDSFPDMEQIVDCWACVLLRGKECRNGGVGISGAIQAGLLFLAEGEQTPRELTCYIPFSARLDRSELTQDCFVDYAGRVSSVDARMLSGRKALVRVNLISDVCVWQKQSEQIACLNDPGEDLQLLRRSYPLSCTVDLAERAFAMQEEAELPTAQPAMKRLLHWTAHPQVQEVKPVGSRLAFRGTVDVEAFYLGEDDSLNTWSLQMPFTQYAEMNCELGEAEGQVSLCLTGREAQPDETGRRLQLNMNLLAQCQARGYQTVELLEDLYSTKMELQPQWQQVRLESCLDTRQLQQSVREVVQIETEQVEHAQLYVGRPQLGRQDGQLQVQVPLQLQLLCRDEAGALRGMSEKLQVQFELDAAEDCVCLFRAQAGELFCAPAAGGVEVRCTVQGQAEFWLKQDFSCVCAAGCSERAEDPERPSVVIRQLGEGESLWEIAKACRTTVSALCQVNDLQEETVGAGALLLIPLH